jgi:uncharacterized protein DUF6526
MPKSPQPQSFENHRVIFPLYHHVLAGVLAINTAWSLWRLIHALWRRTGWYDTIDSLVALLLAGVLWIVFRLVREWPLRAQDRVIRLEMQMRLDRILPEDLKPRVAELSPGQIVALRFASDEELPALFRRVVDEKIGAGGKRDEIKRLIKDWQPDTFRF